MLQEVQGDQKEALSAGEVPGTGSRQRCPSDPWVCLCGTMQETSEIFILLTLMGEFSSYLQWLICGRQSCLAAASRPGIDTRGCLLWGHPEVNLITVAPLYKNGHLCHID